jgi:putative Mg2+ transporter-C (MgtC) family protein
VHGLTELEIAWRLFLGAALGGLIGLERQVHGRPAGFRTHLLVCVASVLLMIVSASLGGDPGRLAAGAITGIGFLGAGVILKSGLNVHGLTTAACLWIVSAIGLSVGAGFVFPAVLSCAVTIVSLWILRAVEDRLPRLAYKYVTVVAGPDLPEESIREAVTRSGASIGEISYDLDVDGGGALTYRITIASNHRISERDILDALAAFPSVRRVSVHR